MSTDLRRPITGTPLLLSQLVHSAVVNPGGDRVARVQDVIVRLADGGYPRVSGLKVRIGGRDLFFSEKIGVNAEAGRVPLPSPTAECGRLCWGPGGGRVLQGGRHCRHVDVT